MNDKLIPFLKSMWENTISPTVKNAWSKNKQNTDDIIRAIKEKENSDEVSVNNLDELVNPIIEAQNATTEAIKQIKGTDDRKEVEVSLKGVSVVAIKGDTGEKGEDGKDGKDGQDGYTPKKFKDYFTKEEIDQIIKKVQKSIRIPKDGEDGYTPIAGVNYPSYAQIKKQIEELVALFPTPKDGFTPDHEWNEEKTQIRFKNADGWGEWSAVLKGENGKVVGYGGGGANTFLELNDTPQFYTGQAGKFIKVKSTENGLEFGSGDGVGDTLSPATNTDSYIPQWNGADSKTLKNGLAVPAGGLAGLTALGEKLDISSTTYALLAGRTGGQTLVGGSGVTDILKLQGTAGNGTLTSAAIQLKVGNNGATTAMTVLNNGNVGIGTGSPAVKLDVYENNTGSYPNAAGAHFTNTYVSGRTDLVVANSTGETGVYSVFGASFAAPYANNTQMGASKSLFLNSDAQVASGGTSYIGFITSGYGAANEKMRITSTGNVGIGTTTPTAKLQIKGAGTGTGLGLLVTNSAGTARLTVRDDGAFAFKGGTVGVAQTGYTTFGNLSTDRTCDANSTTVEELADILGTLIEDLKSKGLISA